MVIHEPSNIEITNEKLQCLRPRGWLNDEVNILSIPFSSEIILQQIFNNHSAKICDARNPSAISNIVFFAACRLLICTLNC